jgi:hypothetical protein
MKLNHILFAGIFATAFAVAVLLFGMIGYVVQSFYHYGAVGTMDLLLNWACVQTFLTGGNPYDASQLLPLIEHYGFSENWNPTPFLPPWDLVLLSFIYFFDFPVVVVLWAIFNFYAVCIVTLLLADVYPDKKIKLLYLEIAVLIFFPLWQLLHYGHIGILLSLGFAGTIWAQKKGYPITAGFFMVLLTVKFHVTYLLLVAFFLLIFSAKQWKTLTAFLGGFALLNFASFFRNSSIFEWWFLSIFNNSTDYFSATLVGWIRYILLYYQGYLSQWPIIIIPVFAIACLLYVGYIKMGFRYIEEKIHVIACVSVFTAPYGWPHDFVVLIVTQIVLVYQTCNSESSERIRKEIITYIILINFIALVLGKIYFNGQHYYFWFPCVLLFLWYRGQNLMRQTLVWK